MDASELKDRELSDFRTLTAKGAYLSEGQDVFEVDKDVFGVLRRFPDVMVDRFDLFECVFSSYEADVDADAIVRAIAEYRKGAGQKRRLHVRSYSQDQHHTTDLKSLMGNYDCFPEHPEVEDYVRTLEKLGEL